MDDSIIKFILERLNNTTEINLEILKDIITDYRKLCKFQRIIINMLTLTISAGLLYYIFSIV